MRMRTEVWLALMATMTWGASASAMPPDAERLKTAAEEFDAGRRAYKLRDFENSAIHFENADRDAPSPEALQSAIRGRKEAGQAARAATLSALGLARYPNDKSFGEYARQVLAESERGLHKVSIGCSPECTLIVDNKVMPFGETSNAVVYVEPGAHAVVAGWSNNRHKNADVAAVAAGTSKIAFTAPAIEKTPAPEPPPAPEPATPRDPAEI
ncbi:MAG TPA: hypothetical protein VJT73_06765, partial [Polyangiaceae bacterium]|nr:hypothetical protein [Polyangiaceae bacterium]